MAAGVSLPKENIELLRKRLNENSTLTEDDLCLKVLIDMQLPIEYISMNLVEELKTLAPFGKGNEKPIFADKNLKIKKLQILGKAGNVLKLTIENSTNYRMTAIMFDRTQEFMGFIKEKFGQEEINKALLGQNNAITFMEMCIRDRNYDFSNLWDLFIGRRLNPWKKYTKKKVFVGACCGSNLYLSLIHICPGSQ